MQVETDQPKGLLVTFTYDAWGRSAEKVLNQIAGLATNADVTPIGYASAYTDRVTGLDYMRARWYDPSTGQFLTVDPLTQVTTQRYAYAADDPIDNVDPTGLCWGPTCWSAETWGDIDLVAGGIALAATGVGLAADIALTTDAVASSAGLFEGLATASSVSAQVAGYSGVGSTLIDGVQCVAGVSAQSCFGAIAGAAGGYYGFVGGNIKGLPLRNFINAHAFAYGGLSYAWDLTIYLTAPPSEC